MIDIQKTAREATLDEMWDLSPRFLGRLEKFAALIREAVVEELVAGSGGPCDCQYVFEYLQKEPFYTADQLAGAVLRERERCAKVCDETVAHHYMKQTIPAKDEALLLAGCADCAAAIRSGE